MTATARARKSNLRIRIRRGDNLWKDRGDSGYLSEGTPARGVLSFGSLVGPPILSGSSREGNPSSS